jgi:IS5 family transposase
MIGKQNKNANFFDSYVFDNLLPKKHILLDIKKEIDFSFVEEELKDLYDTKNGRPAYPPEVLFKMLFLEFYYNLSDVEVVQQCQVNILYRYFIDLSIDEEIPDDTTLVVFRKRCGSKRFERLFNQIIETCKRKNLLSGKLKIADATAIEGDVSVPNRVNLLRQGRKIVISRIAKVERNACDNFRDYINDERLHGRPSPQEVKEEMSKTEEFIKSIKGQYGDDVDDFLGMLTELCEREENKNDKNDNNNKGESINKDENNDKGTQPQRLSQEKHIVSFTDTDVRFGAKSDSKKFVGYKAHIVMDESGIITSVNLLHGQESESIDLPRLLKKEQTKGIEGSAVTADSLYDSSKNREFIHKLGMKAYIPPRRKERDEEGFIYDPKKDTITCPYGNIAKSGKCRQESGTLYNFNPKICRACINKCKWYKKDRCRLFVSDDLKLRAVDRDDYYNEALKKRKDIERKFGEAKKWHGLRRARYRGKWRVTIQVLMTFIVVNIKRMVKILKEGFNKVPNCSSLALEKG